MGHEGIDGNELVDQEAKRAAKGLHSDKIFLPLYLLKPLLINPSAIKQEHNAKLKAKWKEVWHNSDRGKKRTLKTNNSTP